MDVLSNLLELVDVKAALPCRLEANGSWAFKFAAFEHIRVGAVLTGTCWLVPEGSPPVRLRAGDCYLLSSGRPYRVASSLEAEPIDGSVAFARVWPNTLPTPGGPPPTGWLAALGDERIRGALALMHREAERSWTVGALAQAVGMSRSAFALRFRELVGVSPLDYLARRRIQSAARTLRTTDRTIGSIATDLGFSSDSVFSRTFKRMTGTTPSTFRAELPH